MIRIEPDCHPEQACLLAAREESGFRLPILGRPGFGLRCISTSGPANRDIERLTEWRNTFGRSFLTEFVATSSRTREWLIVEMAGDTGRILFMIEEDRGDPLGCVGLAAIDWSQKQAEVDSVIRGSSEHPGIMSLALQTLINWARDMLGIYEFKVRVLEDNPALRFYEKFGFRETSSTPLGRVVRSNCVAWEPIQDAGARVAPERRLVHMELSP